MSLPPLLWNHSAMTTLSFSVLGINQLCGGYPPKIETYWTTFIIRVLNHQSLLELPLKDWIDSPRWSMWLWLEQVLLHGLDWSDLPRTKVWAGGKIITLLHRSTWLCRVIAILGSLTTTERCFIEGTRDQPLGGADQGNPPPLAIAKPQYYIMSGTISTAFLPGGYKSTIFSYKQNR